MKKLIRKYLYSAAPRAYYNILLNALGFNALRTAIYNFIWKMKNGYEQKDIDPAIKELEENGIVSIENFLSDEEYKKLLALYEKAEMVDKYSENTNVPQYASKQVSTPLKLYDQEVAELIIKNERFNSIVSATARKKINVYPKMTLEKFYTNDNDQIDGVSPDRSDTLHYDVPFNSMRAFLYLKPCDEKTAAFVYGKGTHKFHAKRMKLEYYDSIKQSIKRRAFPSAALDEIDKDLLKEINYEPTTMSGNGNTLVIFNAMGMHKRGKFHKIGSREALLIDYRTLDTPLNFWLGMPVIGKAFNKVIKAAA